MNWPSASTQAVTLASCLGKGLLSSVSFPRYPVVSQSAAVSGVLFSQNLQRLSGLETPGASKRSGRGFFHRERSRAECDLISRPLVAALFLSFFFSFLMCYLLCATMVICDSRLDRVTLLWRMKSDSLLFVCLLLSLLLLLLLLRISGRFSTRAR